MPSRLQGVHGDCAVFGGAPVSPVRGSKAGSCTSATISDSMLLEKTTSFTALEVKSCFQGLRFRFFCCWIRRLEGVGFILVVPQVADVLVCPG